MGRTLGLGPRDGNPGRDGHQVLYFEFGKQTRAKMHNWRHVRWLDIVRDENPNAPSGASTTAPMLRIAMSVVFI